MVVQIFAADFAVEGFDECVIRRFAWAAEVQCNTVEVSPQIEVARDEFAALIDTDCFWTTDLTTNFF